MTRTAIAAAVTGLVMLAVGPLIHHVWDQDALLDHLGGTSTSQPVQP